MVVEMGLRWWSFDQPPWYLPTPMCIFWVEPIRPQSREDGEEEVRGRILAYYYIP